MPPQVSPHCAPVARRLRSATARRCASRTTTRRASRSPSCSATSSPKRCSAPQPGEWAGPFRSDFGLHAVRLRSRTVTHGCRRTMRSPRASPRSTARQRRREANEQSYRRDARALRGRHRVSRRRPPSDARRACRWRSLRRSLCAAPALAHRLSPAFFGLTETAPNSFDVQWKVSISGGLAAVLEPQVPDGCSLTESVRTYVVEDMRLQHGAAVMPGRPRAASRSR